MACAPCNKRRAAAEAAASVTPGTYRVMVGGRQVYESTNESAAQTVADRFDNAVVLKPGETA